MALAKATGVDLIWLASGASPVAEKPIVGLETLTRVSLYRKPSKQADEVVATQPGILTGVAFCRSWLGRHGFDAKQLTAANIRGNRMEPTIRNGDNILIDVGCKEILDGDALMVKRLQRQLGGRVRMISDNPLYPMIEAPIAEVDVVGRVVWRGSLL